MLGASPKAIQELMRHADLAMTQRYTHLSPDARESAVRLLDETSDRTAWRAKVERSQHS